MLLTLGRSVCGVQGFYACQAPGRPQHTEQGATRRAASLHSIPCMPGISPFTLWGFTQWVACFFLCSSYNLLVGCTCIDPIAHSHAQSCCRHMQCSEMLQSLWVGSWCRTDQGNCGLHLVHSTGFVQVPKLQKQIEELSKYRPAESVDTDPGCGLAGLMTAQLACQLEHTASRHKPRHHRRQLPGRHALPPQACRHG